MSGLHEFTDVCGNAMPLANMNTGREHVYIAHALLHLHRSTWSLPEGSGLRIGFEHLVTSLKLAMVSYVLAMGSETLICVVHWCGVGEGLA